MRIPSVYLLSLGCSKNLVDSELILGKLKNLNFDIKDEPRNIDLAIINTCGFIKEAKEESIEAILEFLELKKAGEIKKVIVTGCLVQRYMDALKKDLKEVDGFLGVEGWKHIEQLIVKPDNTHKHYPRALKNSSAYPVNGQRATLTPPHYVYIKISEGCNNLCSYCSIANIRGRLRSRPIDSIKKEASALAQSGILKEINLVSQDTTMYGYDLYGKPRIIDLLKELDKIKNIDWFRILYTHPAHFSAELIRYIGSSSRICRYIDLPLQHISDKILLRMGRRITKKQIHKLIKNIRKQIPNVALRTSFIVGFPGETDKDFKELIEFIKEVKFEHLGAFIYSREENTKAFGFGRQLPDKIKRQRYDCLIETQKEISRMILEGYLGKTLPVLIDEKLPDDKYAFLGRTEFDAPEVDGTVIIKGKGLKVGTLLKAKIMGSWEYDLLAERV